MSKTTASEDIPQLPSNNGNVEKIAAKRKGRDTINTMSSQADTNTTEDIDHDSVLQPRKKSSQPNETQPVFHEPLDECKIFSFTSNRDEWTLKEITTKNGEKKNYIDLPIGMMDGSASYLRIWGDANEDTYLHWTLKYFR
jgi:hypothetical protein